MEIGGWRDRILMRRAGICGARRRICRVFLGMMPRVMLIMLCWCICRTIGRKDGIGGQGVGGEVDGVVFAEGGGGED